MKIAIDSPADLQVLYYCANSMEQDVIQAYCDDAELESIAALMLKTVTFLARCAVFLRGLRQRISFRGFAHKEKGSDDPDDRCSASVNSFSHSHLVTPFNNKEKSDCSPRSWHCPDPRRMSERRWAA
jgi:hypothetical protein